MADLKPCPFCGGEAEIVKAHSNTTEYPYVVVCKNDLCNASVGKFSTSREKAIEAWNTRKPMEAVVAELEKEYDLADKEKARCMRENLLQYDEAKGYARGIDTAIEIVRGKE